MFTATLAWRHARAEPARLPLLALRLLPGGPRRRARGLLNRSGALAAAYARWDEGARQEALSLVDSAARGARPRRLARLAAFTLAVERPDAAAPLVRRLPAGRARERLRLRLAAQGGARDEGTAAEAAAGPAGVEPWLAAVPERAGRPGGGAFEPEATRVLHLVTNSLPHVNAGYTQRTHRIVRAQAEAGLQPHVATRLGFPLTKGIADTRPHLVLDGVDYHHLLPWRAPRDDAEALREGLRLAGRLVERVRPSVLHAASNHGNAALALALGRRYGLPVVYEVRGFLEESWLSRDPARTTSDPFYVGERARETAAMRAADLVVTLGEAMRAEIAGRGVDPAKVLVVPNAVEDQFRTPLPDGSALRTELGFAPDDVVIGTTTTCYPHEGLDTLIDALALLRKRGAPARVLIVGDGPELGALRRRAQDLGLGEHAVFPGRVPAGEVRRYHAVLDLFAVPRTGARVCRLVTPLKPVEAMAGGLPVVASDVAALAELVEHGVTGELIPPEDAEGWADTLERLIYSPELRQAYGRAAQRKVDADRTWRKAATTYLDAYNSLRPVAR
ncbi:glycosyltransferase family 4 protein [Allonocardiopsis opalescens]|uniref:Glycosyltransferase involved in cell wall biosynthesis n=1 Tax=Allonocardiopsis opalescens TaxID=1144618 RepID=A0A2T0QC42_9ACTN|nr:glycosyltransferase family 4 protein [Allonocardiopsis opalescens]PRY01468.1 glycosyltransferase involved in cell wall biosynthesis [Allonocardiopsis opalescens]